MYQPDPTVTTPELAEPDPTVRCEPAASGCRSATAELSKGQPAVSKAMTATTIASQRSLSPVVLPVGPCPVSSAATKQLTEAVRAAAEDRDDERGERDDDDRDRHQPQPTRRRDRQIRAATAVCHGPDGQAEQQDDEARHGTDLQHGSADCGEAHCGPGPGEPRPVGRVDHRWSRAGWGHTGYLVAESRTMMAATVATPPMVAASSRGSTDLGSG